MARAKKTDALIKAEEADNLDSTFSNENVAEVVNLYISQDRDNAPVFIAAAPMMMTVKEPEKGYRQRNIDAGQEFILTGVRVGKKADFICEFAPMDTRPYDTAEIEDGRMEILSPMIDSFLAEAVGFKGMSWKQAKVKFFKERTRSAAEIKAAEEAREKQESENFYNDDKLFGLYA